MTRTALENVLFESAPREALLAESLGSCMLITSAVNMDTRDAIRRQANACHRGMREDADHKLVRVGEFASRCGFLIKYR